MPSSTRNKLAVSIRADQLIVGDRIYLPDPVDDAVIVGILPAIVEAVGMDEHGRVVAILIQHIGGSYFTRDRVYNPDRTILIEER